MRLADRLAGARGALASRARITRPRVVITGRRIRPLPEGLLWVLRQARLDAGMSQRGLAMTARVSQAMVARMETGERSPSRVTVNRLAAALRLDEETHEALLEHASPYWEQRPLAERLGRAAATPWRLHDLAELRRRARLARRNGQRGRGGRPRRRARLGVRLRSRKEVRL